MAAVWGTVDPSVARIICRDADISGPILRFVRLIYSSCLLMVRCVGVNAFLIRIDLIYYLIPFNLQAVQVQSILILTTILKY